MLLRVRTTLIAVVAVAGLTAGAAATASAFTSGTSAAPALIASASPPVTGEPEPIPSGQPSAQPTGQPTAQPSAPPTGQPTAQPTAQPAPPTGQPSEPEPTATATSCPVPSAPAGGTAIRPAARPVGRPTERPAERLAERPAGRLNAGPCTSEYDVGGGFRASVTPEDKKLTIRVYSLNNTCQVDSISTTFLAGQKPQNATIEDKADPNQGKGRSWIFDHTNVREAVNVKIRILVKYTCNGTKDEFTWTFLWNTTGNANVFSPQGG